MQLATGTRLGPYEVTAPIGHGGMGEVYRGLDTRLGRAVAIKISTHEFSDRFEREARLISSLNHPHICTLYDVGPNYLVMELVEGETLAELLARGPLPLDKALAYAIQIVDALAAAHAQGVIHRDLKPGNIIITRNGVKVLDFGLAKLADERLAGSAASFATLSEPITRAGVILGTLAYMSPEQAEAKAADERSDIFSFGTVLYEMIAGQRPFAGDTQASLLAAVLRDQPPSLAQRQPATPRALERVIRKCLEKNPDDRWQSARDLKPTLELIDLDAPPALSSSSSAAQAPVALPPPSRTWLWPAVAAVAFLTAAGLAWTLWPRPQPAARVTRFEVALPPDVQIAANDFYVRVSPDGSKLAFITSGDNGGIWIRDLESVQSRLLPGTAGAVAPFWSPDSRSLGFASGNRLMRVEIAGGPPQVLCESANPVGSGAWTERGEIVFGGRGTGFMQRVSAAGGVPTPLTALREGETAHSQPSLFPDGRHFLYFGNGVNRGLFIGSLDAKSEEQSLKPVAPAEFGATFAKTSDPAGGVLFFVRDGTLMAQPFDTKAMGLTGEPVPVVQQIGVGPAHAHFSVTASGLMAYRTGAGNKLQLSWLDRKATVIEKVGAPSRLEAVSLSPDEKQVAIFRSDVLSANAGDIWLLDLPRNVETRFTTGQRAGVLSDYGAIWSPDGKQLAYASPDGIYVKDAGGAADAKLIMAATGSAAARVTDWTSDGRFLIAGRLANGGAGRVEAGRFEIVALPVQGEGNATVIATPASAARLSPDNHWIAYASNQSARNEVYVRPFAAPGSAPAPSGPVIQISRDGGTAPKWRADGRELFFRSPGSGRLMSAEIEASATTFRPAAPVQSPLLALALGAWDVSRKGDRFLLADSLDRGVQTPITVVTNWQATLRR